MFVLSHLLSTSHHTYQARGVYLNWWELTLVDLDHNPSADSVWESIEVARTSQPFTGPGETGMGGWNDINGDGLLAETLFWIWTWQVILSSVIKQAKKCRMDQNGLCPESIWEKWGREYFQKVKSFQRHSWVVSQMTPYGPWSKVMHHIGNRVPFGGQSWSWRGIEDQLNLLFLFSAVKCTS
jgi:hypothetical protein